MAVRLTGAAVSASRITDIAGPPQRIGGDVDSESVPSARLPGLMRAYIDGAIDLDSFVAEVFPLWRDEGWGPYFDPAQLNPEQLLRAEAFGRRFAELTRDPPPEGLT